MKVIVVWRDGRADTVYGGIGRLEILGSRADSLARPLPPVKPQPGDVLYVNPNEFLAIRTTEDGVTESVLP